MATGNQLNHVGFFARMRQQTADKKAKDAADLAAQAAPVAPPPSTAALGSSGLAAARLAGDKQRKLAGAGITLATSRPGAAGPKAVTAPRTLIGL